MDDGVTELKNRLGQMRRALKPQLSSIEFILKGAGESIEV